MWDAPNYNRCVAYQGQYTGAWYVITRRRNSFVVFPNMTDNVALTIATVNARLKGWIK